MIRPVVALIGDSGTGKSSSFENLPPPRSIILNTENKELPMSNFHQFKNLMIESYKKLDATLDALNTEDYIKKFDFVILDSFTSMTEMIWRYASLVYDGWDIPAQYNLMITEMIIKLKRLKQQVFIVAIPEQKAETFGEYKSYARIKGKELKYGFLEKELAIVLFTHPIYAEEDDVKKGIETGEMTDVFMDYKPNKRNSAKAPRGLFQEKPVNDAKFIADKIFQYYNKGQIDEKANP